MTECEAPGNGGWTSHRLQLFYEYVNRWRYFKDHATSQKPSTCQATPLELAASLAFTRQIWQWGGTRSLAQWQLERTIGTAASIPSNNIPLERERTRSARLQRDEWIAGASGIITDIRSDITASSRNNSALAFEAKLERALSYGVFCFDSVEDAVDAYQTAERFAPIPDCRFARQLLHSDSLVISSGSGFRLDRDRRRPTFRISGQRLEMARRFPPLEEVIRFSSHIYNST
jgi:hypothetical protein